MEEDASQPTQPGTFSSFALKYPFASPKFLPSIQVYPPSDEQTQSDLDFEATQLIVDPRRLGNGGSGLSDEDLADIICILHPSSISAARAASLVHDQNPELTIARESDVRIREKNKGDFQDVDTFELAAMGLTPCDLVLRLSAKLKDPLGGFHFGRNRHRCDFLIGQDEESRRISNIHFRIYMNEHNVLMLEDQSTNGTAVDGVLLRGKEKENGHDYRHTLENGTVIVLTMIKPEIDYRFTVRIPRRELESETAYQQNLATHALLLNKIHNENAARAAAPGGLVHRDPVC